MPLRAPFGRRVAPFPETFRFGVATSDHQCEAHDPAREDIRDLWERTSGLAPRGRATDFWNRWREDVALARGLGCEAFRFSVSWTRVEPEPGRWDEAALAHYREIVDGIVAAGMAPVVTLHHFTWPPHLERDGGMIGAAFPDRFADYAERVAAALGRDVGWWITFNEPTYLPLGYVKLWGERGYLMPPGLGEASSGVQVRAAAALIRNLFLAHREARARIRALHPGARVGANPFVLGLPSGLQRWLDFRLEHLRSEKSWEKLERRTLEGYPDVVGGVVDVMLGALTRTATRERQVLFSERYAVARLALLVAAADPATEVADLAGAEVAVVRGSSAAEAIGHAPAPLHARPALTLEAAIAWLARGRVRAVMSDDLLLAPAMERAPGRYRRLDAGLPEREYAAAVGLNREALLKEVDAAIREVTGAPGRARLVSLARDAAVAPAPVTPPAPPALGAPPGPAVPPATAAPQPSPGPLPATAREVWLGTDAIAAVRRRGELVVGLRRGGSPFASRDPGTGAWSGLEVDIARSLARRLFGDGSRVRFLAFDPLLRIGMVHAPWLRIAEFFHRVLSLFSTVANTDWWYLGMAGRLPSFLCPPECIGALDFVGFDYYWGVDELRLHRLRRLYDSMQMRYARAPVHPRGLRRLLSRYAARFPGLDILIVENGCVAEADGVSRAEYLRAHLAEVQRAIAAGVPVRGYLCWSITSNREWGLPFDRDSDFGLYHVDLDRDPELKRVPTPSAEAYATIIRARDAAPAGETGFERWRRTLDPARAIERALRWARRR